MSLKPFENDVFSFTIDVHSLIRFTDNNKNNEQSLFVLG